MEPMQTSELKAQSADLVIEQSAEIHELAAALAKAQGKIQAAKKDTANPYFETKYADLASVWDVIREPLSSNGLAVVQRPFTTAKGISVVTDLLHASGQWMRMRLTLPVSKQDAQGYGSVITYGRRYSISALIGVASEADDDGNAASQPQPHRSTARDYTKRQNGQAQEKQGETTAERAAADVRRQHQARTAKLWSRAKEKGLGEEAFRKWSVSVIGIEKPSADWTSDELSKLEQAI